MQRWVALLQVDSKCLHALQTELGSLEKRTQVNDIFFYKVMNMFLDINFPKQQQQHHHYHYHHHHQQQQQQQQ